jgi:hypothetical protein
MLSLLARPVAFGCPAAYHIQSHIPGSKQKGEIMPPTAWDFQNQLTAILNSAQRTGMPYVDIESGHLHKQAGGHPHSNERMSVCCEVMRKLMRRGDSVVKELTTGQDATLIIRYMLQASGKLAAKPS